MTSVQNQTNPIFTSKQLLKRVTKPIPEIKVGKGVTKLDISAFHSYIYSMKYRLGITKEEINELLKLEGDDFIEQCYEMLVKKMRIPKAICPDLLQKEEGDKITEMEYFGDINCIFRNPYETLETDEKKKQYKIKQLGILRHELEHFMQHVHMYRHEVIGPKLIDYYSKLTADSCCEGIDSLVRKSTFYELCNMEDLLRDEVKMLVRLKTILTREGEKAYSRKLMPELTKYFSNQQKAFREGSIKWLGILKADSKQGKKAEEYFDDMFNKSYYNKKGKIDFRKYFTQKTEHEAYIAEESVMLEANGGGCLLRKLKNCDFEVYNADIYPASNLC